MSLRRAGMPDRLYKIPLVGDWFEVSSESDGMCGSITVENPVTTELTSYGWSISDPICKSQEAAREYARRDLAKPAPVEPSEPDWDVMLDRMEGR